MIRSLQWPSGSKSPSPELPPWSCRWLPRPWSHENPWECCASDVCKIIKACDSDAIQHLTPMNCAMLAASKDAERYEWVIRYHTSHTGHAPMGKIDPLQILRPNHIKPPEKEGPAPLSPETKETALQMFFTRESKCFTQRLQILGWPSTWCKISSYQKNAGYCATKVQCNSNGIRDN